MAKVFLGFKSTTLVGKNDTVVPGFTVKNPQGNQIINEYIREPVPPSTTNLSDTVVADLNTIVENTKIQKLDKTKYTSIKDKIIPGTIPAIPEEPLIIP